MIFQLLFFLLCSKDGFNTVLFNSVYNDIKKEIGESVTDATIRLKTPIGIQHSENKISLGNRTRDEIDCFK